MTEDNIVIYNMIKLAYYFVRFLHLLLILFCYIFLLKRIKLTVFFQLKQIELTVCSQLAVRVIAINAIIIYS